MDKFSLSRNMGFITGPLMLILGIFSYMGNKFPLLAMMMIFLGVVRIGLTVYSYMMNKRENQD
ncbi:hypothetical protein EMGBS15_03030 [Filimonas sp.]|nr:hypothetical protein EMGBS15_03030 [Filimonas sp.]